MFEFDLLGKAQILITPFGISLRQPNAGLLKTRKTPEKLQEELIIQNILRVITKEVNKEKNHLSHLQMRYSMLVNPCFLGIIIYPPAIKIFARTLVNDLHSVILTSKNPTAGHIAIVKEMKCPLAKETVKLASNPAVQKQLCINQSIYCKQTNCELKLQLEGHLSHAKDAETFPHMPPMMQNPQRISYTISSVDFKGQNKDQAFVLHPEPKLILCAAQVKNVSPEGTPYLQQHFSTITRIIEANASSSNGTASSSILGSMSAPTPTAATPSSPTPVPTLTPPTSMPTPVPPTYMPATNHPAIKDPLDSFGSSSKALSVKTLENDEDI